MTWKCKDWNRCKGVASAFLVFFCLHFTLSSPCPALPSVVLHSFLLFFDLFPLLNLHSFAVQRTGSFWDVVSLHLLVSYVICLHLSIAFSSLCSSLSPSQREKTWQSISHLTVGTLGLSRPEACMTAELCSRTHYLRDHAGGDQMSVFNTVAPTPLWPCQEHWVLSCIIVPNFSCRSSGRTGILPSSVVELCSSISYRNTTLHLCWGKWSSAAHLSVATNKHLHSLGPDCTYIFTQHLFIGTWITMVSEVTK